MCYFENGVSACEMLLIQTHKATGSNVRLIMDHSLWRHV